MIGILKPTLQAQFGWSEIDYADIVFAFQLAYAIGFLFAGRMMDRLGAKVGFTVAIVLWSLAAIVTAWAPTFGPGAAVVLAAVGLTYSASVAGFIFARFALGLGESANFPGAIKVIAEWFPKRERALATGIFNAGTNVGALITPIVVPWITLTWGWDWAFIATGAIGLLWLLIWWPLYGRPDNNPRVNAAELALIRSDPPDPPVRIPWRALLPHRQTWAFAIGKFMTDPVWWLYLFWAADFLQRNHGLSLTTIGAPLVVIYLIADVGSIGGGWLSSSLIKRGWTVNRARKAAMLACALAVTPIAFASSHDGSVGGGRTRRPGDRCASGLVRQSVHARVRHVSATGGGIGRRLRRDGRRRRRDALREADRLHPADDRELRSRLPHRRVGRISSRLPSSTRSCPGWSQRDSRADVPRQR